MDLAAHRRQPGPRRSPRHAAPPRSQRHVRSCIPRRTSRRRRCKTTRLYGGKKPRAVEWIVTTHDLVATAMKLKDDRPVYKRDCLILVQGDFSASPGTPPKKPGSSAARGWRCSTLAGRRTLNSASSAPTPRGPSRRRCRHSNATSGEARMSALDNLIDEIERSYEEITGQLGDPEVLGDRARYAQAARRHAELQRVHEIRRALRKQDVTLPRRQEPAAADRRPGLGRRGAQPAPHRPDRDRVRQRRGRRRRRPSSTRPGRTPGS